MRSLRLLEENGSTTVLHRFGDQLGHVRINGFTPQQVMQIGKDMIRMSSPVEIHQCPCITQFRRGLSELQKGFHKLDVNFSFEGSFVPMGLVFGVLRDPKIRGILCT